MPFPGEGPGWGGQRIQMPGREFKLGRLGRREIAECDDYLPEITSAADTRIFDVG